MRVLHVLGQSTRSTQQLTIWSTITICLLRKSFNSCCGVACLDDFGVCDKVTPVHIKSEEEKKTDGSVRGGVDGT